MVHLEPTLTFPEILRIVVQRGFETRLFLQFGITFGWECDGLIMTKSKKHVFMKFHCGSQEMDHDGEGFKGVLKSSHSKDEVIKKK